MDTDRTQIYPRTKGGLFRQISLPSALTPNRWLVLQPQRPGDLSPTLSIRTQDSALVDSPTAAPAPLTRELSQSTLIARQFDELLAEPISAQHQEHFHHYFKSNVRTKTFTVEEFSHLFQVAPLLGERILRMCHLQEACERNVIAGEDAVRIARLLWTSPMSIKAFILFKLFDSRDRQTVSINDMREFYRKYLSELKFFKDKDRATAVVDVFLQSFFPTNDEGQRAEELTFEQFYDVLRGNQAVFDSLYLVSIPDSDRAIVGELTLLQRCWRFAQRNFVRHLFLVLYVLILIALSLYVVIYRTTVLENQTVWQVLARVGGILVNFNFALAVCLMLKQTMTIIRQSYYIRLMIPVDEHIDAHRYVGTVLCLSALLHSFGHAIQFATNPGENTWAELMFTTAAKIGWVGYAAPITGDILFVILIVMFVCSLQIVRQRSGWFQLFRYTHLLFWPMFVLLVIHTEHFWKWAIGPMTLFVLEKIYLFKRHIPKYGRTRLLSVRFEDKDVISLTIERPKHFRFRIGGYINICFPRLVRNEWHPFTICSGPDRKDVLRVTIMKKQNWTRKVHEHFSLLWHQRNPLEVVTRTSADESARRTAPQIKELTFTDNDKDALICVEGAFSTCTSYIFDCEHVVLIAGGIGVTPYISALENLIHRLRKQRCICPRCGTHNYHDDAFQQQKLKKIDFIWVNRDISNVTWFSNILDTFETEQRAYLESHTPRPDSSDERRPRYLDIHLYCTASRSNEQVMLGHLPYDLIAKMYETKQNEDMHTQLKTPTRLGRPPWRLLFAKFKAEYQSTDVFFTGNKAMSAEIEKNCNEFGFSYQHEPYF